MKIFGKELKFNNNKIYHAGDKPTPSEIGALASSGTAVAASKFATARAINGVAFDGTKDITITTQISPLNNNTSLYGKKKDGSLVDLVGVDSNDRLYLGWGNAVYLDINNTTTFKRDIVIDGNSGEKVLKNNVTNSGLFFNSGSVGFYDWGIGKMPWYVSKGSGNLNITHGNFLEGFEHAHRGNTRSVLIQNFGEHDNTYLEIAVRNGANADWHWGGSLKQYAEHTSVNKLDVRGPILDLWGYHMQMDEVKQSFQFLLPDRSQYANVSAQHLYLGRDGRGYRFTINSSAPYGPVTGDVWIQV